MTRGGENASVVELEERLRAVESKVAAFLTACRCALPRTRIAVDTDLGEDALASHRHPATVVVRSAAVSESVIAHELVHIAQQTLERFGGFRLLYTLLAEGVADWIAKVLYPRHEIRYVRGYELVAVLAEATRDVIGELLRVHDLRVRPEDFDRILASPRVPPYTRGIFVSMADRIRAALCAAREVDLTDPTFVPLGEELQAWKFLLAERFDGVRSRVDEIVSAELSGE